MSERKLRSCIKWQKALKQKGVKQGLLVLKSVLNRWVSAILSLLQPGTQSKETRPVLYKWEQRTQLAISIYIPTTAL
jgi:hypothetical protein